MSLLRFLVAMGSLLPLVSQAAPTQLYDHGDASAAEQYMLELVNRARANPAEEGKWLATLNECPTVFSDLAGDFANYPAVSPVTYQAQLGTSARLHSQDMLDNDYFDHNSQAGVTPSQRVAAQGYTGSVLENIAWMMAFPSMETSEIILNRHAGLLLDCSTPSLGHRTTILDINTSTTEVGIGYATDGQENHYITQDFGTGDGQAYLLGVVYQDLNNNQFYDIGEGISGVTITPDTGDYYAVSSAGGGYAIPIQSVNKTDDVAKIENPENTFDSAQEKLLLDNFKAEYLAENPSQSQTITLTATGGTLTKTLTQKVTVSERHTVPYQIVWSWGGVEDEGVLTIGGGNVKSDFIINESGDLVTTTSDTETETPVEEETPITEPETPVDGETETPVTETETPVTGTETPLADCPNDVCSYSLDLSTNGFYVMRVNLPEGRSEGQWGLSINNSSGMSDGGFSSGSVLRENGEAEGFTSFHLTEPTAVQIETQEYTGAMQQLNVQIKQDNATPVFGPVLSDVGSITETDVLPAGYYVVTVASPEGAARGYFGIGIYGSNIKSVVDVGGMIDTTSGLGFIGIPVTSPITLDFSLFYGANYGEIGAGQPRVELFRNDDTGNLISVWASDAQ